MAKKHNPPTPSCGDCIHEAACMMQCGFRPMAAENALRCPNYTTLRESAAYYIGFEEGKAVSSDNAVEVVRYKDCKWYGGELKSCIFCLGEEYLMKALKPDDFCSCGERRDDNG